ncbi:MAG: hypothetical protein RLZZ24_1665, partial [Pseudomonadota bacterium]
MTDMAMTHTTPSSSFSLRDFLSSF